jgi:hypothetical protein
MIHINLISIFTLSILSLYFFNFEIRELQLNGRSSIIKISMQSHYLNQNLLIEDLLL